MAATPAQKVEMIPIDRIAIINPRLRNKRSFDAMVKSIGDIGLKRPITVTQRQSPEGIQYDLVCGQGRLEAFRQLGQEHVPALIVTADTEDCLVAKAFKEESERKHGMIRRTEQVRGRLTFLVEAMGELLRDDQFTALLEDEGLLPMPNRLVERMRLVENSVHGTA